MARIFFIFSPSYRHVIGEARPVYPGNRTTGRNLLQNSALANELLDIVKLGGKERGEILVAAGSNDDYILVAQITIFFGHSQLRVNRKNLSRLEGPISIVAIVVNSHANRVGEDAAAGIHQLVRGLFIDGLGKVVTRKDRLHGRFRILLNLSGSQAGANALHYGVAIGQ